MNFQKTSYILVIFLAIILININSITCKKEQTSDYTDGETIDNTPKTTDATEEEYYDDEDYASQAQSSHNSDSDQSPPYACPLQCKCEFKPETSPSKTGQAFKDDYEEDDLGDKMKRRNRRQVASDTSSNGDYEYSDGENELVNSKKVDKVVEKKYDVYIDCSKQGLNSINNLFDYDFPMDQIISL
jgi:hypothetical protein